MVQLILDVNVPSDAPAWIMMELQGTLEAEDGAWQEQLLGLLSKDVIKEDQFQLEVGHHCVLGERVKLNKPIAILAAANENDDTDGQQPTYTIVHIVRHKLLFKSRPRHFV